MNKLITLLISALFLTVLVACGGSGGVSSNNNSDNSTLTGSDSGEDGTVEPVEEVDPRIVGDWDFSEEGNFTNNGGTLVDGLLGSGLDFTGTDKYISVPDSENLTLAAEGSVEVWIYPREIVKYAGILHKGEKADFSDEAYSLQFWRANGNNGHLLFYMNGSEGSLFNISTIPVEADTWFHIVATWNAESVNLYINGALDKSVENTAGTMVDTDGSLIIGAQLSESYNATYAHLAFNGIIDGISIYNEVMGAEEVLERYTEVIGE
ncbi:MAG: LamG domain-containing protein [bacterium]|nr:LamG domain-containing protein [bacterium]